MQIEYRNRRLSSIKRLLQIFWSYRIARNEKIAYLPYRLWVEPTALCNLKCSYCPNKSMANQRKLGFMSFDLFKKVIDEACNWVHDINIHHRGESLLHPKFIDMVNYAGFRGVYTKLHTNATRIDAEMAQAILDSSLDLISFSFDGFDKPTYERYRRPGKFESTLENIVRFLRMKTERGQIKPFTVFEAIDYPDSKGAFSPDKRSKFEKNFEDLKLDKFIVKKAHNWAGSVRIDADIHVSHFVPCTFLWHSLVVMWDGKVGPCPQDFMGEIILGDVSRQSLEGIFNNAKLVRLRSNRLGGYRDDWLPCNICNIIRRKEVMGLPVSSFSYLK